MEKTKKSKILNKQTGVNYPVGDFLIRVKNAAIADNKVVEVPASNLVFEVAKLLKELGFIESVEKADGKLIINLSFHKKEPLLMGVKIVSRPGLRIYKNVSELEAHKDPTAMLVSTTKGILSHTKAIKNRVGGEVIAEVW